MTFELFKEIRPKVDENEFERRKMDKDIEIQFSEAVQSFNKEAKPLIDELYSKMDELKKLSQKFGIPFSIGISEIDNNSYFPGNTEELYPGVTKKQYVAGVFCGGNEMNCEGWKHSDASC